jgi:hypothetical protein
LDKANGHDVRLIPSPNKDRRRQYDT